MRLKLKLKWGKVQLRKVSLAFILLTASFLARAESQWLYPFEKQGMIEFAKTLLDRPYSFGARKPQSEDCSSFMQKIFASSGIEIPRSSREQFNDPRFELVPKNRIGPGDLIFFKNTYRRGISHVAMAINEQTIIHTSRKTRKIIIDEIRPGGRFYKKIAHVKRYKFFFEEDYFQPYYYSFIVPLSPTI